MTRFFDLMSALRFVAGVLLAALGLLSLAGPAAAQPTLLLGDPEAIVDVWPAITILADPGGKLTLDEVLAVPARFAAPRSAYATLGLRQKVVWLRASVLVPPSESSSTVAQTGGRWILDIDYSLLNHVDVYVVTNRGVLQHAVLGNLQPNSQRPIRGRSPAVALLLPPGEESTLLLRVESIGAMILPITLSKISAFHHRAINEQMLQGILASLGVFLLLFSLLKWISLREYLYVKYSLLIVASVLFSVHFFGIGGMYLWTNNLWIETHMAGITALMAACGTALFIEDVLRQDLNRLLRVTFKILAGVLAIAAVAHAFDWIDIYGVSVFMSTLGLMPALMGVPGAVARMRRGDSVGTYFLLAWIGYFATSAVMVGVVKGYIGVNFWALHAFQFGTAFDMIIFMRIAELRSIAVHMAAQRAAQEHEILHSLAHTDPLTGLLNRRGLNTMLTAALRNCTAEKMLAVYMLDLDAFKLVNDQFGHDVGDELLEIVTSRLRATMRTGDGIARLGGDEFVVLAGGLQSDALAKELGSKLLQAIGEPFALSQHTCHVGVTIGYTLAPLDGEQAETLLKQADAAMYAGKQSGRNCLRRGAAAVVQ